jgi:pimeloyl-ACP methyl ester carboxylesterase
LARQGHRGGTGEFPSQAAGKRRTDPSAVCVATMDQRNTGASFAPFTACCGWGSYAADQLALMDHLGIQTFAVVGMCIGGAFIMRLLKEAPDVAIPERVVGQ